MKHYLFCLRHFNDIDNITPAIHFLLERRPVRVTVLIYSLDYDYRNDPSLSFLQDTWADRLRVVWIGTLAGYREPPIKKPEKPSWHARQWKRIGRRVQYALGRPPEKDSQDWHASREGSAPVIGSWLKSLFIDWGKPAGVIFDQNRTSVLNGLLLALRDNAVKRIISLPVSPWTNINVLRQTDFVDLDASVFWKKHDYSGFDRIGQVDPYYSENLRIFFDLLGHASPFHGREEILGSLRYIEEWLAIRQRSILGLTNGHDLPRKLPSKKRLLIIPSHRKNNSFWDEYLRTLRFLAQFEEYEILVKPHTRYGDGYEDLPENISLINDRDTSALIEWSEIILFWSSSVALEGFQKRRTMINLDYLNGNRSIFTELNAGYLCRCRDDLLAVLTSEKELEEAALASRQGRESLRREVVQGGKGPKVIERYLEFIEDEQYPNRNAGTY